MELSIREARRVLIRAQGLDGSWEPMAGKDGAARTVERLGYVQIDTISVVERAHHHVFWSRQPDYTPDMLDVLLSEDRRVFEYWGRAACYFPMTDYRFYRHRMRSAAESQRARGWIETNAEVVAHVLDRLRAEGPLRSADFEAPDGRKSGPWWDWKPAKRALELLLDTGEVMVTARRSFQRVYDLAERVLLPGVATDEADEAERARFSVRRSLNALGLITADDPHSWRLAPRDALRTALDDMVAEGEVIPVAVEGIETPRYARPGLELPPPSDAVAILSPFDNLAIDRWRMRELFGFDYTIECYTPAKKRQYGYFCLPILWRDALVGRMDAKAERKAKNLNVKVLFLEPGFDAEADFLDAFAAKLSEFARFNGCDAITIDRCESSAMLKRLRLSIQRNEL